MLRNCPMPHPTYDAALSLLLHFQQVAIFSQLTTLQRLRLSDNPCATHPQYHEALLHNCRGIRELDGRSTWKVGTHRPAVTSAPSDNRPPFAVLNPMDLQQRLPSHPLGPEWSSTPAAYATPQLSGSSNVRQHGMKYTPVEDARRPGSAVAHHPPAHIQHQNQEMLSAASDPSTEDLSKRQNWGGGAPAPLFPPPSSQLQVLPVGVSTASEVVGQARSRWYPGQGQLGSQMQTVTVSESHAGAPPTDESAMLQSMEEGHRPHLGRRGGWQERAAVEGGTSPQPGRYRHTPRAVQLSDYSVTLFSCDGRPEESGWGDRSRRPDRTHQGGPTGSGATGNGVSVTGNLHSASHPGGADSAGRQPGQGVSFQPALSEVSQERDRACEAEKQLQASRAELQNALSTVASLRAYIGREQPAEQQSWEGHKVCSVAAQTEPLPAPGGDTSRDHGSEKKAALLERQVAALQEVVVAQEAHIAGGAAAGVADDESSGEVAAGPALLARWRQEVYRSIVARKTAEAELQQQRRLAAEEEGRLREELRKAHCSTQAREHCRFC